MKNLKLDNVVKVGRYNTIRRYIKGELNLTKVPLTKFGQTGIYNSDFFSKMYGIECLDWAGKNWSCPGGIWYNGWCAVLKDDK